VRFKPGVAHLASALDAVVVPFGLAGTEKVMPPAPDPSTGMAIAGVPISIKRGPLAIAFSPPLGLDPDESMQEFAARLQAACYRLTREAEQALRARAAG
jgi:1-acyl-sn-glycerol-3-phosphate acyltransferase